MESWITLFTAHGKAKVQLSHVLQTELPTIPWDSQLYTFPQIQTYIKSKLFWKQLDNWGFLPEKVWISFHKVQYSNYDKMRKTLLFSSVSINLFSFLTREVQNKIQTFISENALNKGFTEESLDFSKVWICGNVHNRLWNHG